MDERMSRAPETIRVLHVDDDPDFLDLTATFLERKEERFDIETAPSASDGIDNLSKYEFDCIISDYDMPGQNGIEFLKSVRDENPDLPFILYTGKGSEEIASDAISAGVTEYLQKESGSSQYTVLANRIKNTVEQYRAKRDLKASQQRLSLLFEESPLGAIQWNENFEFTRLNETAEDILGYTESELSGNSWKKIVHESDREEMANIVSDLLANKGGYHSVNENITKDGETIVCEWHNRVVTDDNGDIKAIFSQFQDITDEYRRRERRERQREALLELSTDDAVTSGEFETAARRITESAAAVLDVPRVNVWLLNSDGEDDVLTCVDHFDRLADNHGQGMTLTPDEYPAYFQALETHRAIDADDARADTRTAELTKYLDTHNIGALLDATLRAEGNVVGVVCHEHVGGPRDWTDDELDFASDIADITHRALRNQEQREQRRKLERRDRAMDAAPVGITITGPAQEDNPLIYVNEQFRALTGYAEEELLGRNCRFLQGPETRDAPVKALREAIDNWEPATVTLRNYRKDGTEFWNRVSIAPVHDDSGTVVNWVGFQQDVTEEKRQERERATLAQGVAQIGVGIAAYDATGEIQYANDRYAELLGTTRETLLGRPIWEVNPAFEKEQFDAYWESYDPEETRVHETVHERFDTGEELPVRTTTTRVTIETTDYHVGTIQDIGRDISDHRADQQEIERVLELLDHTEQIADVGGWEIDPETQDVFWTDHLFEMLGWGADEEPPLEDALDVYVEEDRPRVETAVAEALETGDSFDVEARFQRADGEIRWFQIQGSPTLEEGEVVALRGAVQDITDSKERMAQLQETTTRLEALFENSPDMIDVLDPDGTVVDVNRRFCEELGYGEDEVCGRPIWEFDQLVTENEVKELLTDFDVHERRKFEGVYERRDGSTFPVEVHLLRLGLKGKNRFLAISRDITERKEREKELETQNQQLEEFASIVSHDLRNPLNVAELRLDLARDECDSEHLNDVGRAHERMSSLIEDLLTLAREGEYVGDLESIDLKGLTETCWANVATDEATVTIEINRVIQADRSRLQQLLENLIRNAIEHGGTDVTITVGELPDGFYVEDDGRGIPEDERDAVFEAGYSTAEEGTGFGLSIVKQVAEAHGWDVRLTAGTEGGARFEITGVTFNCE